MIPEADNQTGCRQWIHPSPRAVFLLVHGLGANTGRWEAMADFFLKTGVSSYAIKLDKSGEFNRYFKDILSLREIIRKGNPSKKIFLAGESMGGLISFLLAARYPALFSGLICISPAFSNKIKLPINELIGIILASVYNPNEIFKVPFDSSMCTRDTEYRKKMDADPDESRSSSARLLMQILINQMRARSVRSTGMPTLFLAAGDDSIIDARATKEIFKNLEMEDKVLADFPGMYHALTIDTGKEDVFRVTAEWLNKRL